MTKMPVLFVGHGSPMNAIEDNPYTRTFRSIGERIPKPEAILSISAHWYTKGTKIMNEENPKMIYDMYGFPKALYQVSYPVVGSPDKAEMAQRLITRETQFDNTWGIDHGTWSVLVHMYPDADIPVFQMSVDANATPETHYTIGKALKSLREQGVLLFCSGNIVHNLGMVDWSKAGQGFDWANEFDGYIHENIQNKQHQNILNYQGLGNAARLAVPTPDHFYPLLYALGASDDTDKVTVHNKSCDLGALSMTAYLWG